LAAAIAAPIPAGVSKHSLATIPNRAARPSG